MRETKSKSRVHDTVMLSGWLFADLLLALAVIFLAANTAGVKPTQKPTPTPTAIIATPTPTMLPTPTPAPVLDLNYVSFTLDNVDYNGLLNNTPSAINDIERRIRSQTALQGRRAGLAIVYGGAPTSNDIGQADQIANKVYTILHQMGQGPHGFVFQQSVSYKPLYNLGDLPSTVEIDVFLFHR